MILVAPLRLGWNLICVGGSTTGRYIRSGSCRIEYGFPFSTDKSKQQWQMWDTTSGYSTLLFAPVTFRLPSIGDVWHLTAHVGWIWHQSLNTFPSFYCQHIGPLLKDRVVSICLLHLQELLLNQQLNCCVNYRHY